MLDLCVVICQAIRQMNTFNSTLAFVVVMLIISYATGYMMGGHGKGWKIVSWELKKLTRFCRWVVKLVFQTASDFFGYLAKQCADTKKKTP